MASGINIYSELVI